MRGKYSGRCLCLHPHSSKIRTSLLLITLLIPIMLGQYLRPVQGALTVQITSVVSPSVARPGDSFIVKVNGDYSSSGPFTMVLSIVQLNGVPAGMGVGTDTYTSSIQPPETGTWGLAPTLQAYTPNPNEYDSSGKFAWQLEVEVNGVSQKFTVTIIKPGADPYIKIVGVDGNQFRNESGQSKRRGKFHSSSQNRILFSRRFDSNTFVQKLSTNIQRMAETAAPSRWMGADVVVLTEFRLWSLLWRLAKRCSN